MSASGWMNSQGFSSSDPLPRCLSVPFAGGTLAVSSQGTSETTEKSRTCFIAVAVPRTVPSPSPPTWPAAFSSSPHKCPPPAFGVSPPATTSQYTMLQPHCTPQPSPCSALCLCPCSEMAPAKNFFTFLSRFSDDKVPHPPSPVFPCLAPRVLELHGLVTMNCLSPISDCHLWEDSINIH